MSSTPPRRPSPGPRSTPNDPATAAAVETAVVDTPAAGAALPVGRRWRRPGVRTISVGAIAAGVAVFVVTSTITPLAGADTASGKPHHPRKHTKPVMVQQHVQHTAPAKFVPLAVKSPASSTSVLTQQHTTATSPKASVDSTVISGLAANGIPSVALNAYRVAAARVDNDEPSCGIRWSLLAGIGREESDHGQFGGAVLHADGVSTPAIIGPALTGKGNQFIPAPPNGLALDGDAKYAHALGPMQFIPSTWAVYGTDADGDGQANIFDINDASLATARYLCAAGGDLTTQAGRVRAVFAYNHTDVYVAQVLALAHAYQTGTAVTGLPNRNTTGSLPGLGHAGSIKAAKLTAAQKAEQRAKARARRKAANRPPVHLGGGSTNTPTTSPSPTHTPQPTKSHTSSPHPTSTPTKSKSPSKSPSKGPTASPTSSPGCLLVCLPS